MINQPFVGCDEDGLNLGAPNLAPGVFLPLEHQIWCASTKLAAISLFLLVTSYAFITSAPIWHARCRISTTGAATHRWLASLLATSAATRRWVASMYAIGECSSPVTRFHGRHQWHNSPVTCLHVVIDDAPYWRLAHGQRTSRSNGLRTHDHHLLVVGNATYRAECISPSLDAAWRWWRLGPRSYKALIPNVGAAPRSCLSFYLSLSQSFSWTHTHTHGQVRTN
jgi:hypothetical protein